MDAQPLWSLLLILALVAIAVAGVFSLLKPPAKARAERARQARALAGRLGLRYYGAAAQDALSALPPIGLLQTRVSRTLDNLIGEPSRPPNRLLFELVGSDGPQPAGDDAVRTLHVVSMVRLPRAVQLDPVRLFREDWLGGPVGVKGLYRLHFDDDERFGFEYVVAGGSRERVRALLTKPVRDAVKAWGAARPWPVVEVLPGWVVAYVESDIYDRNWAGRAERLLLYASNIAARIDA
jgi:hypothetical protein